MNFCSTCVEILHNFKSQRLFQKWRLWSAWFFYFEVGHIHFPFPVPDLLGALYSLKWHHKNTGLVLFYLQWKLWSQNEVTTDSCCSLHMLMWITQLKQGYLTTLVVCTASSFEHQQQFKLGQLRVNFQQGTSIKCKLFQVTSPFIFMVCTYLCPDFLICFILNMYLSS